MMGEVKAIAYYNEFLHGLYNIVCAGGMQSFINYLSFMCLSLIPATYLNSYFPASVTAAVPAAGAISSVLSDFYHD